MSLRLAIAALLLGCAACSRPPAVPAGPPPEAEVRASSGAVKIVLALHKMRVPLSDNGNYKQAHVFFRATLTNIGREEFYLREDMFDRPEEAMSGLTLDVVDAKGRAVERWPFIPSGGFAMSPQEARAHPSPNIKEPDPVLKPGSSRSTLTSVHQLSKAQPVEGYVEIPFQLDRKGSYKVRLVYDRSSFLDLGVDKGTFAEQWKLRVATPFVPFTVE